MIYTLTLNPAIDYYMSMENFQLGSLNSLEEGYTLPGGKGINVSKVLKNFSVESKALGFVGGFTGDYIKKHLNEYEIESDFIELQENTRINIKLKSKDIETVITGKSPTFSLIATRISSTILTRLSKHPPYSSVRLLTYGLRNSAKRYP